MTAEAARAFDRLAPGYDEALSSQANPVVPMLRQRFYAACSRHFPPGATLLELGCGTGTDALALAARGHRVVATDLAPAMIERARAKAAAAPAAVAAAVDFHALGVTALAERWPLLGRRVDGVYSNLAPLNCELSLTPLRALLEQALPAGGCFVAVVLPRVCPLEVALFLATGKPGAALRRFARAPEADVGGQKFPMRYLSPDDFDRALGLGFHRVESRALGLLLPPLRFGPAFARVPGLLDGLARIEDRLATWPGLSRIGDHILLAYQRR